MSCVWLFTCHTFAVNQSYAHTCLHVHVNTHPNITHLQTRTHSVHSHSHSLSHSLYASVKLQKTEWDWCTETVPERTLGGRVMPLPRGKVLGGCSSTNAMLAVRCDRDCFNWCEGWTWDKLLPYFKKMETYVPPDGSAPSLDRGTDGPLHVEAPSGSAKNPLVDRFVAGCECVGIPAVDDYNSGRLLGASVGQQTVKDGIRHSTAAAYLPAPDRGVLGMRTVNFRQHGRLTIACLTTVTRVNVDGTGRVVGVTCRRGSSDPAVLRTQPDVTVRCRREVILSCGAYHTPHILMLSGIGRREALEAHGIPVVADVPGVGENLSDHLLVMSVWPTTPECKEVPITSRPSIQLGRMLAEYVTRRSGPASASPLQGTAFFHSPLPRHSMDGAPAAADSQFHFLPCTPYDAAADHVGSHLDFSQVMPDHGVLIAPSLLRPLSRGSVTLATSDPFENPIIHHNYLAHPRDAQVLLEGLKLARRVMRSSAWQGCVKDEFVDPSIDAPYASAEYDAEYVRKNCNTIYHPVGTCRIGKRDDPRSVVTPTLCVKGVSGLRVADASIMPHVPNGNTNLPCVMVGERAADIILADALRTTPGPRARL